MPPALPLPTHLELADRCSAFLSVAFSGVTFRLENSEPLVRRTQVRLLQCGCEACVRKEGRSRAPPPANLDSDILILLGQVSSQLLHLSQRSRLAAFGRAYAAASLVHGRSTRTRRATARMRLNAVARIIPQTIAAFHQPHGPVQQTARR